MKRTARTLASRLVSVALCLLSLAVLPHAGAAAPKPPNIVFIVEDDLGWGDVSYHGSEIQTPNLDRFAAEGAELDAHYTTPVCSPTRAEFMTGRYGYRCGIPIAIPEKARMGLPTSIPTLAEVLHNAGYETAMVGKWHLGYLEPAWRPTRRGFEHQYGGYTAEADYFTRRTRGNQLDWHRDDGPALDEPGYTTILEGDEAVHRIEQHDPTRPLFLYLPFNAPHLPLGVPAEWSAPYAGLPEPRRTLAGMIACMDAQIGRVRDALERTGLADNTLVVLASDNGANLVEGASPGPFRGGKHDAFEGGIRTPAIAWFPSQWSHQVFTQMVQATDWVPTLLHQVNVSAPAGVEGKDITPLLVHGTDVHKDGVLLCNEADWSAYRSGNWKILNHNKEWYLFNLGSDSQETQSIVDSQPALFLSLQHQMAAQIASPGK